MATYISILQQKSFWQIFWENDDMVISSNLLIFDMKVVHWLSQKYFD